MLNILESTERIPHPTAIVLAYPAIDFNYQSWMTPRDLQTLRTEQSSRNIPGIIDGKDHMRHKSPLTVVSDVKTVKPTGEPLSRKSSWQRSLSGRFRQLSRDRSKGNVLGLEDHDYRSEEEKSLRERVKTPSEEKSLEALQQELRVAAAEAMEEEEQNRMPLGTRLTMTSRTGYFLDRIISPTMVSMTDSVVQLPEINKYGCVRCARWQFYTLDPNTTQTSPQTTTSALSSHLNHFSHNFLQYSSSVGRRIPSWMTRSSSRAG